MKGATNCESCINYIYDEDWNCYQCEINLDEDEMSKFLTNSFYDCPYFQFNDEYKIVRKQIQFLVVICYGTQKSFIASNY